MKYFTKTSIVLAFFAIVVLIACESKPTTPNSLSVKRWVLGQVANDDSYLYWYDMIYSMNLILRLISKNIFL